MMAFANGFRIGATILECVLSVAVAVQVASGHYQSALDISVGLVIGAALVIFVTALVRWGPWAE